jgi:hypothetical protein
MLGWICLIWGGSFMIVARMIQTAPAAPSDGSQEKRRVARPRVRPILRNYLPKGMEKLN